MKKQVLYFKAYNNMLQNLVLTSSLLNVTQDG